VQRTRNDRNSVRSTVEPSTGDQSEKDAALRALLEFKGEKIRDFCTSRLLDGTVPHEIFSELQEALEEIGRGYEDQGTRRYFNSDLIVSGRNMKRAIGILRPYLPKTSTGTGRVVVGTVAGDVHDIGKTIFAVTLESEGFDVIDIGVDAAVGKFVDAVREFRPDILSMSALLSTTAPVMEDVIAALREAGLRDPVKIIVGGHAVTADFANAIGADAYGRDCVDGLRKCQGFMRQMR
jgi:methanogenic corrinoid protein MtbC1